MGFKSWEMDARYEERIRINARRVKAGWAEWLHPFPWEEMLTLTTDPTKFAHASEDRLSREVYRCCQELSYLSRRAVGWIFAIEGGGGVSLHSHVLTMKATKTATRAVLCGWQARYGKTHRREVTDTRVAVRYLCKQIGPNGDIVFSDSLSLYRLW